MQHMMVPWTDRSLSEVVFAADDQQELEATDSYVNTQLTSLAVPARSKCPDYPPTRQRLLNGIPLAMMTRSLHRDIGGQPLLRPHQKILESSKLT